MLCSWSMHAVEARSSVLNPSLGRTSSAFEVVEVRRKLARKTEPMDIAVPAQRKKRPTAQVYFDETPTLADGPSASNRANRFLTGVFLATAIALMAVVLGGLG